MKKIKIKISWLLVIPVIILAIIVVGQDNQENTWKKALEKSARLEAEANDRIAEYEKLNQEIEAEKKALEAGIQKRDKDKEKSNKVIAALRGKINALKNDIGTASTEICLKIEQIHPGSLRNALITACNDLLNQEQVSGKLEKIVGEQDKKIKSYKLDVKDYQGIIVGCEEQRINDERIKGELRGTIEDKKKLVKIADKKIKKLKFQRFLYAVIAAALVFFGK